MAVMVFWATALMVGIPLMLVLSALPGLPNIFLRKVMRPCAVYAKSVFQQWINTMFGQTR